MTDTPKPIEITHFINPNKFFFKYTHMNNSSTELLQMRLNDYYSDNNCLSNRAFFSCLQEGSKVVYLSKTNWIRCQIDKVFKINLIDTVVLWSIDYGYPIRITSENLIKMLTPEFGDIPSPIMCGGLNVLPAEIKFNFETMSSERCRADEWSTRACILFRNTVSAAKALLFVESGTLSDAKLGDLIVNTSRTTNIKMSQKLIEENVAITEQDDTLELHFTRLSLKSADRWNDDKTRVTATADKPAVISGLSKGLMQKNDNLEMNYNMKVLDWKERNQRTLEDCEHESMVIEINSIRVEVSNEIKTEFADPESFTNQSIEPKVDYSGTVIHSSMTLQPQTPVFLAAGCDIGQYITRSRTATNIRSRLEIRKPYGQDRTKLKQELNRGPSSAACENSSLDPKKIKNSDPFFDIIDLTDN